MKKTNIEERERRYGRASGKSKSREYLLQRLNDYYGSYENRIKIIGITCLDCKRQLCLESCIDKSRIELN